MKLAVKFSQGRAWLHFRNDVEGEIWKVVATEGRPIRWNGKLERKNPVECEWKWERLQGSVDDTSDRWWTRFVQQECFFFIRKKLVGTIEGRRQYFHIQPRIPSCEFIPTANSNNRWWLTTANHSLVHLVSLGSHRADLWPNPKYPQPVVPSVAWWLHANVNMVVNEWKIQSDLIINLALSVWLMVD